MSLMVLILKTAAEKNKPLVRVIVDVINNRLRSKINQTYHLLPVKIKITDLSVNEMENISHGIYSDRTFMTTRKSIFSRIVTGLICALAIVYFGVQGAILGVLFPILTWGKMSGPTFIVNAVIGALFMSGVFCGTPEFMATLNNVNQLNRLVAMC